MENALLFTGLLLGAALTGGYFGACCAKSRQSENVTQELLALRDRVEFLETKTQDADERLCLCERYDGESAQRMHELEERAAECELLIGETPDDGLLNRVGAMEEAHRKEDLLRRVNLLTDEVRTLGGRFDTFEGGASLEIEGLRKSVEALEGKAHG